MLIKKITRHSPASARKPPSRGPATVVIVVAAAQAPMALPRRSGPNEEVMMARLPGIISAPPIP